jgi:hypothetical protein
MQGPAEDQDGYSLRFEFPTTDGKLQLVESAVPLRWRPVIVSQSNAMMPPAPVHKSHGSVGWPQGNPHRSRLA